MGVRSQNKVLTKLLITEGVVLVSALARVPEATPDDADLRPAFMAEYC